MELKVVCDCGQKYKFDVEPIQGRMPFVVNCPVCGIDGTPLANNLLSQMPMPAMPAAIPIPPTPQPTSIRINRAPAGPPPIPTTAAAPTPRPIPAAARGAAPQTVATPKYLQDNPATQNNNFALGFVGAILGSILGAAFLIGADKFFGFTLSYFAVVVGAMIGFGARLLYRGTSSTLGAMCAGLAFITIAVTLFVLDGLLGLAFDILYLVVGTLVAFKVAS